MKVLLCGASGLSGRVFYDYFIKNNINCIGTYFSNKTNPKFIKLDFFNYDNLKKNIIDLGITTVISNIAERQNEICETDWNRIKKINIDIPYNLSKICNELNIYFIHLSTDYVYDGQNPPFSPTSLTNPLQNYGISKLIAEQRIISNIKNNYLILRVPVLYSNKLKSLEESAVPLIIKKVMNKVEEFQEDNFSIRRPLFIEDLAEFIKKCIINNCYGIHCYYNPYDKYTKYEIAKLGAQILNKNIDNIKPVNKLNQKALRPKDTNLYDSNIKISDITLLEKGLNLTLKKFIHPKINFINKPNEDILLLFDFDGTILKTDNFNWECYNIILNKYNKNISYQDFLISISNSHLDIYFREKLGLEDEKIKKIRNEKYDLMYKHIKKSKTIQLMPGMEIFLNYIEKFNINHCVVTNTSIKAINLYREHFPILNKLKNWVTRENYNLPKPNSECYKYAINKYNKNEKYILGFEDSIVGYKALKEVTDKIYIIIGEEKINYNIFKKKDVYLIDNYKKI